METIKKKLPLWQWILLFIGAMFLGFIGYAALIGAYQVTHMLGLPVLTVVCAAIVLGIYALLVKALEEHWPTNLPMRNVIPHTLLGLLVGFLFMAMVVSSIVASGCAAVSWSGFSWAGQFDMFMIFLAVAVGEEILFRGVIFRFIDERWNMWVALLVSALLFGFMHISNDNATWWSSLAIAIEAGLLLGAAYKWSGTLWVPIGIHWAWNYTQGNIFGLAVSGANTNETILATTVNGPDIITGGAFGPEASIITVILGIFITLVFLRNRYRHSSNNRNY